MLFLPFSCAIPVETETSQPGDPLHHQSEQYTDTGITQPTDTGITQPGSKPFSFLNIFN